MTLLTNKRFTPEQLPMGAINMALELNVGDAELIYHDCTFFLLFDNPPTIEKAKIAYGLVNSFAPILDRMDIFDYFVEQDTGRSLQVKSV